MSGINEAEQELEKVEEALAKADRAIQISRLEHERLSSDLDAVESEQVQSSGETADLT